MVCVFKQPFLVFKQYFTYFNALFHPHVFPQMFSNNNFHFLNTYTKWILEIGFKVGYGNVHGNRNNSKGRPKKSGNQDKSGSQSLHIPKKVESVKESTNGNPIKSSL